MSDFKESLKPTKRNNVVDLLRKVGMDVPIENENRHYSSNWAFVEGNKVVLCLWRNDLEERDGTFVQEGKNYRKRAETLIGTKKIYAVKMDRAIRTAAEDNLKIRVIVCSRNEKKSGVKYRELDPMDWGAKYDMNTGECKITRIAPKPH